MLSKSLCLRTCFFGFPKRDPCLDGTLKQKNLFFFKNIPGYVWKLGLSEWGTIELGELLDPFENTSLITYGWRLKVLLQSIN